MKWIFLALTVVLLFSWSFRWTEINPNHEIEGHAVVSYKLDRWTGQMWAIYFPPVAMLVEGINIPLFPSAKRFKSNDEVPKELEKQGKSGQLVDAWRKRDLATYTWGNLTLLCFIGAIWSFLRHKRQVKDFDRLLN
ncbi:hypothetical protein ACQCN2_15450 [Brevibacillus ginsengisoli]|uniref:hypothetical protein n=1 Tax=Brevibacillus ginsengisoli TaxID=363854 RepID=UPI003CF2899A